MTIDHQQLADQIDTAGPVGTSKSAPRTNEPMDACTGGLPAALLDILRARAVAQNITTRSDDSTHPRSRPLR